MEKASPLAERLAQLSEENDQLREAARAFGELAERLMRELDNERRHRIKMTSLRMKPHRRMHQPVA